MKKFLFEKTVETLNKVSGDIEESVIERTFVDIDKDINFVKIIIPDKKDKPLKMMAHVTDVFLHITYKMTYDNVFVSNEREKLFIAEKLCIELKVVEAAIRFLVKNDFLLKLKRPTYMINPYRAVKGDKKNIRNVQKKYEKYLKELDNKQLKEDLVKFKALMNERTKP